MLKEQGLLRKYRWLCPCTMPQRVICVVWSDLDSTQTKLSTVPWFSWQWQTNISVVVPVEFTVSADTIHECDGDVWLTVMTLTITTIPGTTSTGNRWWLCLFLNFRLLTDFKFHRHHDVVELITLIGQFSGTLGSVSQTCDFHHQRRQNDGCTLQIHALERCIIPLLSISSLTSELWYQRNFITL